MSKAKLIISFLKPALTPAFHIWVNDAAIHWLVIIRIVRVLIYHSFSHLPQSIVNQALTIYLSKYFLNLFIILP